VQSVQFDETSHSISQGQPYEGVFTLGYYLDVKAGRHGSEEVAHDFNAGVTPDNALGLATFSPDTPLPSELNFAVFGTLSVTIDSTTDADCAGPQFWNKQLVDRRHQMPSSKRTYVPLRPYQCHIFERRRSV